MRPASSRRKNTGGATFNVRRRFKLNTTYITYKRGSSGARLHRKRKGRAGGQAYLTRLSGRDRLTVDRYRDRHRGIITVKGSRRGHRYRVRALVCIVEGDRTECGIIAFHYYLIAVEKSFVQDVFHVVSEELCAARNRTADHQSKNSGFQEIFHNLTSKMDG